MYFTRKRTTNQKENIVFQSVSPATVRSYFAAQGTPIASTGRIKDSDVKAYNKANKGRPYRPTEYKGETVTVTAKPEKGRSVTRKVYVSEVRAAALAAGVKVGERGRLPKGVAEAHVLGTLHTLAVE